MSQKPPERPLAWPWKADSPLDRARRVAGAYRAALAALGPEECARIDDWAARHGQGWVAPTEWPYTADQLITTQEVAELCHVKLRTVYAWHQRGLPWTPTPQGIRVRVGDLEVWERLRRLARL